jgi:Holliday junction resolvase RusA-like endonuclease
VYNPSSADAWKNEIKMAFHSCRQPTIIGPARLKVLFCMPVPNGKNIEEGSPHTSKPDTDNLFKAVMDAMTAVGVWKDDALVSDVTAGKFYARGATGAQIIVETDF